MQERYFGHWTTFFSLSKIIISALTAINYFYDMALWDWFIHLFCAFFRLNCCRAMSKQRNMFTYWTRHSQQQREQYALYLRITSEQMVLRYQKPCDILLVERPSYLSRTNQPPMKPKGRNRRPSLLLYQALTYILSTLPSFFLKIGKTSAWNQQN